MKTIEERRLMGEREDNSDGFTYPYGKFKFNKNSRSPSIRQQIRNDKRSRKAKEFARIVKEEEI